MHVRHLSRLALLTISCFESTAKVFRQDSDVETRGMQVLSGGCYGQHQSS